MRRIALIITLVTSVATIAACSASSGPSPIEDGPLAIGTWGGDTAGMLVSDTSMHVHIGCTFGDASVRPALTGGAFEVDGSYMLHAFPVAVGPTVPAHFSGRVDGKTLEITAVVNDTVAKQTVRLGPVRVRLGQDPVMGACPICHKPGDMAVNMVAK